MQTKHILLLTLYVPRCSTTQGKFASLPTATVTFGMGWAKRGSSIITVNKKLYNVIKKNH